MNAFAEDFDAQVAGHDAAQRGGQPELLVIAAAGVEADDERGLADAAGEVLDVRGQVGRATLLAGFDQDDAAGVGRALLLQEAQRRERGEGRIAVVGAAAAVELVAFAHRFPGRKSRSPSAHLRLLVEMAIEQHRVGAAAGDLHEDDRRALFQANDFQREARDGLLAAPALDERDRAVHVARLAPGGVVGRGFVGNADVVEQGRDDLGLPDALRGSEGLPRIE